MGNSIHNPDQYMASLRPLIAQGRKRLGFLIGAGAPVGICPEGSTEPLIPDVSGLTSRVLKALDGQYKQVFDALRKEMVDANIETLLSRVRNLGSVIGKTTVHGLDGTAYEALGRDICTEIGRIVDKRLPSGQSPYTDLVSWVSGTSREHAVEIFTTNYDLLFEEAFERAGIPFFDGFAGTREPFFDPSTVASDDLPARWTRMWKLHGSLGWCSNAEGEVIRKGGSASTHLVFPEFLKYDRTQKAPYSALFDRLRTFLRTPDTLLIVSGFSFADAHISAVLGECLAANPSVSVFAFQFNRLEEETYATAIASRRGNMTVYCPDKAMINGIVAPWRPGSPPTKDWEPIRATYWTNKGGSGGQFTLGSFSDLARFFASSRSAQGAVSESASTTSNPIITMTAKQKPVKGLSLAAGTEE
ncbi:MAG: SIR2 family NAD-dependent protein deacylase [Sulfobacillus sp.]